MIELLEASREGQFEEKAREGAGVNWISSCISMGKKRLSSE